MTEITDFASIVRVVTVGFALAVLATKLTERVSVPAPAIFLLAAAAVSDIWPGVYEAVEIETVERIAVVALVVILFNGGLGIGWRRFSTFRWANAHHRPARDVRLRRPRHPARSLRPRLPTGCWPESWEPLRGGCWRGRGVLADFMRWLNEQ
jgi:hypothetical protein